MHFVMLGNTEMRLQPTPVLLTNTMTETLPLMDSVWILLIIKWQMELLEQQALLLMARLPILGFNLTVMMDFSVYLEQNRTVLLASSAIVN